VQATELALLRQLGDDLGSWRYRVDSASAQTAHVLQALNNDLDKLKLKVSQLGSVESPSPSMVEDLASQMRSCYQDLHTSLNRLQNDKPAATAALTDASVQERLNDVERQLTAAQSLLTTQGNINSAFNVTAADLRASAAEAAALAEGAATDAMAAGQEASAAVRAAAAAAGEVAEISTQVNELRLGLEVVESALEDLDVTDELCALRSRMDDLDAGIERSAGEALGRFLEIQSALSVLRRVADSADHSASVADAKATKAAEVAEDAVRDIGLLRREVRDQAVIVNRVASMAAATASSASSSSKVTVPSDPRFKAAVHTLSDGYRSLHRAMSLMYEEQAETAGRVAAVGVAALQLAKEKSPCSGTGTGSIAASFSTRMKHLNSSSPATVASHPVPLSFSSDSDDNVALKAQDREKVAALQLEELRALVAAQAAESALQARKAAAMEEEIRHMRRMLCGLAPVQAIAIDTLTAPVSAVNMVVENERSATPEESFGAQGDHFESGGDFIGIQINCDEVKGNVRLSLLVPEEKAALGDATNTKECVGARRGMGVKGARVCVDQEQIGCA